VTESQYVRCHAWFLHHFYAPGQDILFRRADFSVLEDSRRIVELNSRRPGEPYSMKKNYFPYRLIVPILAALAAPVFGQTQIVPLNTLVANQGSLTAGDMTFSNFHLPQVLPSPIALLGEFNDIGVSATTNVDGTVSLAFVAIDPLTGLPQLLTASPTAGGEQIRLVRYTITVTNSVLRVHSIDQKFGPQTTITGNNAAVNGLYTAEAPPNVYDQLLFDEFDGPGLQSRATMMPSADGTPGFSGSGGILLPGGNLATYNMANEFGLIKGHQGVDPGGTLDSITMTYSLVQAGSPVPVVTPNIAFIGDSGIAGCCFAENGFTVDSAGIGGIILTNFAQDGGAVITLTSSNPAALTPPATVTVPQGYWLSGPFLVGNAKVDAPMNITLSASFNGRIVNVPYTVNPPTPLVISSFGAAGVTKTGATLFVALNRENLDPATIQLTSSNPAIATVPASLTLPALTQPGDFRFSTVPVSFQPVAANTPVTFSASFGGVTQTATVIIPHTVDTVQITRAELVVKTGSLRVEATGSNPAAVLTLFNTDTGQLLGTMTNTGLSGSGAKYSFQGTVSPVTTVLAKSSLNGTATSAVVQK
jgi:hypothetical protein